MTISFEFPAVIRHAPEGASHRLQPFKKGLFLEVLGARKAD
jgi:hypothetical protein